MSQENEMLDELKKIRELLSPPPPPPLPKNMVEDFKKFLREYKVMGLAVGFIMGIYLGTLVGALVADLVMPVVELFAPASLNWEDLVLGPFRIGHFIGEVITFLIVALVIFVLVKITKRIGIE